MTKLLMRLFLKGDQDPKSTAVRSRVGLLSGIVGIICNALLFAGKLLIGTVSGSVSITADAMNNLSDATSAIVTLLGFKLAEKPADSHHPYGHARYEYLSGLAVAAMIVVIGFELAKASVEKIFSPAPVDFSAPVAIVLVISIAVKLWLALFNTKLGKFISSSALQATASDSRNDAISTTAVLAAAIIEYFTQFQADGYIGLAVALFILYSGANLARETISPLLGENASPELRQLIADTVGDHPMVLGYHDLMVHDYGPGQRFASMHVEMDQDADPMLCHNIIDDLERQCLEQHNVHLVLHYDPVVTGDEDLDQMRQQVAEILARFDSSLTFHDFRMVRGVEHTNLIFDVVLPVHLQKQQKAIQLFLNQELNRSPHHTYYTVITFDIAAFNLE